MNNTDRKCRNCFFGMLAKNVNLCECHFSRPVSSGKFPLVRVNDYCGYWTDEQTLCRPFAYMPSPPYSALPLGSPLEPQPHPQVAIAVRKRRQRS